MAFYFTTQPPPGASHIGLRTGVSNQSKPPTGCNRSPPFVPIPSPTSCLSSPREGVHEQAAAGRWRGTAARRETRSNRYCPKRLDSQKRVPPIDTGREDFRLRAPCLNNRESNPSEAPCACRARPSPEPRSTESAPPSRPTRRSSQGTPCPTSCTPPDAPRRKPFRPAV